MRLAAMRANRNSRIRAPGIVRIAGVGEAADEILNDFLGIERLTRSKSRTGLFALPALHAGIEAQKLIPAKVRGRLHAEFAFVENQWFQRRRSDASEALWPRMKRQMQKPSNCMLHRRADPDAEHKLRGSDEE